MEVTTQVPETGQRIKIDADRQFDGQTYDSVVRIQGQNPDGTPSLDATMVQVDEQEAEAIGKLIRSLKSPQQEVLDRIAQEVQATFSAKLSGRDAQQIAHLVHRSWWEQFSSSFGSTDEPERASKVEYLAERFYRAAGRSRTPFTGSASSGNGEQQQQSSRR